ncbi:hypothetical protein [Paraherbaspirillum soli]|uniref:Uncharacterized protein n=1 Tax=Paraherbaspirillum soli TaxID=631222 RepID=A0ABW0M611_9BURK
MYQYIYSDQDDRSAAGNPMQLLSASRTVPALLRQLVARILTPAGVHGL